MLNINLNIFIEINSRNKGQLAIEPDKPVSRTRCINCWLFLVETFRNKNYVRLSNFSRCESTLSSSRQGQNSLFKLIPRERWHFYFFIISASCVHGKWLKEEAMLCFTKWWPRQRSGKQEIPLPMRRMRVPLRTEDPLCVTRSMFNGRIPQCGHFHAGYGNL